MAKNQVKLLLNLILIGLSAIPRGGLVKVEIEDPNGSPKFRITSSGVKGRVPPAFLDLLNGTFEETLDAHAIQPVYTLQLAQASQMEVTARLEGEDVVFLAKIA